MSSVLPDLTATYNFVELLDIEEQTGNKYELLDGHIVAMTGGTKAHNLIALGLFSEIDAQKNDHCRLYVADVKLRINREHNTSDTDTATYPDVMLACGDESSELYEENPLLIAEVLSDSSARKDKTDKKEKYLSLSSLQVYLVLSQTEIMLTVYQRNDESWDESVYLGKDTEIDLNLGTEHKAITLSLGRIYKYLENRI